MTYVLQDDIWHVNDHVHARVHALIATRRGTLYIDVTVGAPLTVTCVSFGLNLSSLGTLKFLE